MFTVGLDVLVLRDIHDLFCLMLYVEVNTMVMA
jgi:hypothetical protein